MAYFDHAATTPMLPEAIEAMTRALSTTGNASSLHTSGRRARRLVEEAREDIADALGARPSEVIFTSGGTESDNLAVKGVYWSRRTSRRRRVVASSVEHHAVLDAVQWLVEHEGAEVTWLPPDGLGRIRPEVLRDALDDDVALVTAMWANNEVGTINPVRELAALDLEPGEFDVLTTLRRAGSAQGMTAGAFLSASLVTAGAITNRIDRMAAKGLVRRVPDAADRRVVRIKLTDRGARLVDGMLAEHMRHYARLLEGALAHPELAHEHERGRDERLVVGALGDPVAQQCADLVRAQRHRHDPRPVVHDHRHRPGRRADHPRPSLVLRCL